MMTHNDNISFVEYGGIAQLARAHGSYPWCRWFKSDFRYFHKAVEQDALPLFSFSPLF